MRILPLGIFMGLFACTAQLPESRGDKLAKSLCGCTGQLMELNKQAEMGADSLAFQNIAAEFAKARLCASKLGVTPEDSLILRLALKEHCPTLAGHVEFLPELLGK